MEREIEKRATDSFEKRATVGFRAQPTRHFVLVVMAFAFVPLLSATTSLYEQLPSAPQECNTCHTAGPGSARNVFGEQVEQNTSSEGVIDWSTLCGLDADGDGQSNGAELGDPCCVFAPGVEVTGALASPSDPSVTTDNLCVDEPVLDGWLCSTQLLTNDECDCGCGVIDPECESAQPSDCDSGSCGDGVVDVLNTGACLTSESESRWTCGFVAYADGEICDCGCGVVDPDCENESVDACDASGCRLGEVVDESDTKACVQSEAFDDRRPGWWCPADWYGSDDGCDCGCGLVDPDCPRATQQDDCSQQGCIYSEFQIMSALDPQNIALCVALDAVPSEWTCESTWYGSDDGCDCGCGIVDPDCEGPNRSECTSSNCTDGQVVELEASGQCVTPHSPSCSESTPPLWCTLIGVGIIFRKRNRIFGRQYEKTQA